MTSKYILSWVNRMQDIPQPEWDALALPLQTPFLEWEWLNNLETSGSATPQAGWLPNHLIVRYQGELVAAAPLYIKGHSYGEFVFDHSWANVAYRLGIEYYPKMLGMTPFTPATGYRFLIAPDRDEVQLAAMMVSAIDQFCQRHQISSCNFLFVDPQWQGVMENLGFMGWLHHSYIWTNQNFQSFDDYLAAFNANQRRNIKRERKAVNEAGLRLKVLNGEEIPRQLLPMMYSFYSSTCDKFWGGSKYLTKRFFEQLYPNYCDRVVLIAAYHENYGDRPVGMSFCLTKGENLYGRYWGCLAEFDCLHFDACYYTPIEWAIDHGIRTFDPGAGGKHKKRRGFPATPNYSLHRFYNDRLTQVFQHYIHEINTAEQQEIEAINEEIPFTKKEVLIAPELLASEPPAH
jgi:predicted N-acyltransferase